MIYLELLYITIIVVCIVGISGFMDSVKLFISRVLTKGKISKTDYNLKPFDCQLCMSFWSCLAYLIITGQLSLLLLCYTLLLAVFTPAINELIVLTKDLILKFTSFIYEHIID